jgi:AhpD family alkylhydroperoxidase
VIILVTEQDMPSARVAFCVFTAQMPPTRLCLASHTKHGERAGKGQVRISAVADDQLRDQGVVAISFASPHETPVRGGLTALVIEWEMLSTRLAVSALTAQSAPTRVGFASPRRTLVRGHAKGR